MTAVAVTTYDADADALYIRVREGAVARTDVLDSWTMVDVDADGAVIGVEVVHPTRRRERKAWQAKVDGT